MSVRFLVVDMTTNNVLDEYATAWDAEVTVARYRESNPHIEYEVVDLDIEDDV